MKTVFNFISALVAGVLVLSASAGADETFWTTRDLLGDRTFFHSSEKVTYRQFDLASAERARIEQRLGYRLPKSRYTIFVATTGTHIDGYAVFDEELGEHMPITFAVKVSPVGVVERQEVVAYREARGDEVRDERFKRQFVGKTARDALRPGDDIAAVSGATISSQAMAVGVKRALVLVEELILRPRDAIRITASR